MTTDMQTIRLGFGKINLRTANATYAALRVKPPFLRDSAVTSGQRRAYTAIYTPVSGLPRVNGTMVSDSVAHPNGTIIMLQVSWRRGSSPLREGVVLLKLREQAALLSVNAALPQGPESIIGAEFQVFAGRADVLSVDEAKVMKIEVPNSFVSRFFNPTEVEECFSIHEVAPEVTPPPQVSLVPTSTGLEVRQMAQMPSRRLRFRR